jgi:hypothetical protein
VLLASGFIGLVEVSSYPITSLGTGAWRTSARAIFLLRSTRTPGIIRLSPLCRRIYTLLSANSTMSIIVDGMILAGIFLVYGCSDAGHQ